MFFVLKFRHYVNMFTCWNRDYTESIKELSISHERQIKPFIFRIIIRWKTVLCSLILFSVCALLYRQHETHPWSRNYVWGCQFMVCGSYQLIQQTEPQKTPRTAEHSTPQISVNSKAQITNTSIVYVYPKVPEQFTYSGTLSGLVPSKDHKGTSKPTNITEQNFEPRRTLTHQLIFLDWITKVKFQGSLCCYSRFTILFFYFHGHHIGVWGSPKNKSVNKLQL